MKKLALAFVATVFAFALAAPTADACPGKKGDKNKVVKKDDDAKKKPEKIAKKDSKKDTKKESKKEAKKN